MLSSVVKEMIECRFGTEIRYPSDCESLARDIASVTRQRISVTTLKRLCGFVNGVSEPRVYTLDILASYIGYRNYNELVASLSPDRQAVIERLWAEEIGIGTKLRLTFCGGKLCVEKVGEGRFCVESSSDRQLRIGDMADISVFRVDYPLFVHDVCRNGVLLGDCVVAKVSGLVRIEVHRDV